MLRSICKSKIHRAAVTETHLSYDGSITIDSDLLAAADVLPHEKVQIVNLNNGERFETYAIAGEAGGGAICMNGAAARLAEPGDMIIVISYCLLDDAAARKHEPIVVKVDADNKIRAT